MNSDANSINSDPMNSSMLIRAGFMCFFCSGWPVAPPTCGAVVAIR